MDKIRFVVRLGAAALVALFGLSCAQERAPVNRVEANALAKTFFVGKSLSDTSDDPEFYASTSVVDVPFGVSASVFTGATGELQRIKWEITEHQLNARLTYETVQNVDGKGSRTTNSGAVVASFSIQSHFDIKRDYNPQTGEELNVVVENTSDRPWYERDYFRVDWSSNKIVSAYSFDPLALLHLQGEDLETLEYRTDDPGNPDAPVFVPEQGYFDITNKIYIKPRALAGLPACYYDTSIVVGGTAPYGSCDPAEVKLRLSFLRIAQPGEDGFRDYQPQEWDGARFNAHGAFTRDRLGYDRHYGIVDTQWHHLIQRYNIWQKSHADVVCASASGGDVHADTSPADGTEDSCAAAGAGSQCDDFVGKCTIPFAKRSIRPIAWHFNLNGADDVAFESSDRAAEEWDTALRLAVQAARRVECQRTGGASLAGTRWEGQACEQAFPINQEDDAEVATVRAVNKCRKANGGKLDACRPQNPNSVAALDKMIALCHSPVLEGDDPMCGPVGLVTRPGDLRYHQVNVVPTPQTASPWGYGPSNADPLTGEVIQASINVWNSVTDQTAQLMVDQIRWLNGEIPIDQITTGDYVQEWARAASIHSPGSSPLMTNAEIDKRIAASGVTTADRLARAKELRRSLDMTKLNRQILTLSNNGVGQPGTVQTTPAGSTAHDEAEARIGQLKGTPIEAALFTTAWKDLAGVPRDNPALAADAVADLASPLRGMDGDTLLRTEQQMQTTLAEKGQCMLLAPEPNGLVGLAKIIFRKFPYDSKASAKDQADRVTRMWNYLRGKLNYSVIAHEMGHTVGLRHNFASSFDKFNYRPQYWQLRTHTGTVTQPCAGPVDDGSTCVGPRYFDPLDQDEIDNLIWMWSQTSIMDYAGDMTQDTLGIGVYDYSAARAFYGDVVDVRADGVTVPPSNQSQPSSTKQLIGSQMFDLVDTVVQPLAQSFVSGMDGSIWHYSRWNELFNLVDKSRCRAVDLSPPADWNAETVAKYGEYDPVFDGHIVHFNGQPQGEVCDRVPVDYVDWRDMVPDTSYAELVNYNPLWIVSRRALDKNQRPRMPYAFGTDNAVEAGIPSVYQHDNGADIYEEMQFHDSLYEDRHIFDNFRRGRVNFSLFGAYQRAVSRYHGKIGLLSEQYSFTHDYILRSVAQDNSQSYADIVALYEGQDGPLRDYVVATGLAFDHFVRALSRPQPGPHSFGPAKDPVLRPLDGAPIGSMFQHDVDIPQGSSGIDRDVSYGGRSVENGAVSTAGYWNINSIGDYYEKTHAIYHILAQGAGGGNWSRLEGIDTRWLTSNFSNLYPDGVRRLVGAILTDDHELYAPRIATRPSGLPNVTWDAQHVLAYPARPMGWVSFTQDAGPAICWPSGGLQVCTDVTGTPLDGSQNLSLPSAAVDPELGFEVQKFVLFYSYVFLPVAQRNDWLDMLRLYRLSVASPSPYSDVGSIEFMDPQTNYRYVAKKVGDEQLLGKTYDKGIGAKMLQWANHLASLAYQPADPKQPFDPVTGKFLYATDNSGQPIVLTDPVAPPSDPKNVRCEDNRYCTALRNYRGLLDFSHDIAAQLGFLSLELNGIAGGGVAANKN